MRARIDLSSTEELEAINSQARDVRQRLEATQSDAERLRLLVENMQKLRNEGDPPVAMASALQDTALDKILGDIQESGGDQAMSLFLNRFDLLLSQAKARQIRAEQQSRALQTSATLLETDIAPSVWSAHYATTAGT